MSGGQHDLAIATLDRARQLLDAVRTGAGTEWRWLIRTDLFDAIRQRMEDAGALASSAEDQREPTLLGIPYDLGWPALDRPILLTLSIEPLAPNRPAD